MTAEKKPPQICEASSFLKESQMSKGKKNPQSDCQCFSASGLLWQEHRQLLFPGHEIFHCACSDGSYPAHS